MTIKEFRKATEKELKEYGKNIPKGETYDENENLLTYKTSDGHWYEYTYDENGYETSYKTDNGYWYEFTYDEKGNELTCIDSNGDYEIKGKEVSEKEFDKFIKENK